MRRDVSTLGGWKMLRESCVQILTRAPDQRVVRFVPMIEVFGGLTKLKPSQPMQQK
jgi:hypothetical protein